MSAPLTLVSERWVSGSPEQVWEVLLDAGAWVRWCGAVRAVHTVPEGWVPGERLSFTLAMGPGVPVRFDVTLQTVDPPREVRWTSTKWWGVRGTRTFRIVPEGEGVRVFDEKCFESRIWPVGWVYPRGAVGRMSDRWLADLAAEVARRSSL